MAVIREELVLADRFSAALSRYTQKMAQASRTTQTACQGQRQIAAAAAQGSGAMSQTADSALEAAELMEKAADACRDLAESARQAAQGQRDLTAAVKQGQSAADQLGDRLLKLISLAALLQSAISFVNLSDTFTQTTARLERMNDGLQTTAQLQQMIYESAQRSRGDYQQTADMVAKLGTMAGDAFSSNAELIAFAEQLNKQFALAGTSAQGMDAAMLQLTQAMSSGALRGEELNSVLEQAPTVAQTIADYMGVSIGEMRELASEGKVGADVVKAALLSAAEETNKAFEAIPLTFSQAWTMAKNAAIQAMEPAMQKLNQLLNSELGQKALNGLIAGFQLLGQVAGGAIDLIAAGAQWVVDNWEFVSFILAGTAAVAALLAAKMIAAGGASAVAAMKSAAAWATANWPITLFVASIALIIWFARQMGVTWEEIGGVVGGVFGLMYAFAMNLFLVPAQNGFARFANFLGNLFSRPAAAVKMLFLDMAISALGYLSKVAHGLENLINMIPGVNMNLARYVDGWLKDVQGKAQSVQASSGWKEYVKPWEYVDFSEGWNTGKQIGGRIGRGIDHFSLSDVVEGFSGGGLPGGLSAADYAGQLGDMAGDLKGARGDTAAIRRSVSLAEEDIKLLADMAQREYVNNINLTAQTPVITINGQNTGDTEADLRWLENALKQLLIEQAASHTDLRYV